MRKVGFMAQEHLGTGIYRGPFDRIVDIAVKRAGRDCVFTVTSTGDDRLPTDRRFEIFADSARNSKKYTTLNIGSRGILILDKNENPVATAYNSVEYETGNGHFVAYAMPRDTNVRTGKKMTFQGQLAEISEHDPIVLLGHPTFKSGLAKTLIRDYSTGNSSYFGQIDGCAIYSGTANAIPGSNTSAFAFFRDFVKVTMPHVFPYLENDSHTLMEFARVKTRITHPEVDNIVGLIDEESTLDSLRASLGELAGKRLDTVLKENKPTQIDRAIGFAGAVLHKLDLDYYHPRRLRRETA